MNGLSVRVLAHTFQPHGL